MRIQTQQISTIATLISLHRANRVFRELEGFSPSICPTSVIQPFEHERRTENPEQFCWKDRRLILRVPKTAELPGDFSRRTG